MTPMGQSAWGSGKLILWGEHAVVYGEPAVAVALPQGLKVTLTPHATSATPHIAYDAHSLSAPHTIQLGETEHAALDVALTRAVSWAREQGVHLSRSYQLSVEGALPFKVGLGSSAALAVATLRALARCEGRDPWSKEALFAGAMEMERVFHVRPSGLDHQVSIVGGALRYQRQGARAQFKSLCISTPLILVLTWVPRRGSTADAVRGVAERRAQDPDAYASLFNEMGHIADEGLQALERGWLEVIGDLLNRNHICLEAIGVSTSELNSLCQHLRSRGALGAKMSGAGHGGVCLGLFRDLSAARAAARDLDTPSWVTTVDSPSG